MTRPLRAALDEANPNKIATELQAAKVGSGLVLVPRFLKALTPGEILILPEEAKAAQVLRCFVTSPAALLYLTPADPETTPAAGSVAVTPTGDIVFAAADNVAAVEVLYAQVEGEIFEDVLTVAASVATLPQGRGAVVILEAQVLTGVLPATLIVDARGTAAPAAGHAAVNLAGTGMVFNAANVVAGTARVRYIACPGVGNGPVPAFGARLDAEGSL